MGHLHDEREAGRRASARALDRWIALGLPFRSHAGRRYFDLVETNNFMRRARDDDDFFSLAYVATLRQLHTEAVGDAPSGERPRRVDVDFSRTFDLRAVDVGTTVRLRAPLPRVGRSLYDLTVRSDAPHDPDVRVSYTDGRLEARGPVPLAQTLTLGARLSFTVGIQRTDERLVDATDVDLTPYLREREGLVVVSARVAARAASVTAGCTSPLEATRRLWAYVCDDFTIGALHYDQIDDAAPCDWALDGGWLDCRLAASLLVALCRARRIPARVVGGYMLYPIATMAHYWAEVWIDERGWMPLDFIGWDIGDAGRDHAWRDRYFERLDYRIVTERLPREFTGAIGVPMPNAWSLLQTSNEDGTKIALLDEGGSPAYVDTLRVVSSTSLED